MINTIMFDLDGTLLQFSQKEFISVYFAELSKVFIRLGLDAEKAVAAVWAGTKAMVLNDGSVLNVERFWQVFGKYMDMTGERLSTVEAACDSFYTNEFNAAKSVMIPCDVSAPLVRTMAARGYDVVLATNPLFPLCAVESRLGWIELDKNDFLLITHYSNSNFCKPNPGYYREVLEKIGKKPEQCIMIGNNPGEDMIAAELGIETFLVTDCLENEANIDISGYRQGTLAELAAYLVFRLANN